MVDRRSRGMWLDNEGYGIKTQNAELCFLGSLTTFSLFSPSLKVQFWGIYHI